VKSVPDDLKYKVVDEIALESAIQTKVCFMIDVMI